MKKQVSIPLAVAITLGASIASAATTAGVMRADVDHIGERVERIEATVEQMDETIDDVEMNMARHDQWRSEVNRRLDSIGDGLDEISALLRERR